MPGRRTPSLEKSRGPACPPVPTAQQLASRWQRITHVPPSLIGLQEPAPLLAQSQTEAATEGTDRSRRGRHSHGEDIQPQARSPRIPGPPGIWRGSPQRGPAGLTRRPRLITGHRLPSLGPRHRWAGHPAWVQPAKCTLATAVGVLSKIYKDQLETRSLS